MKGESDAPGPRLVTVRRARIEEQPELTIDGGQVYFRRRDIARCELVRSHRVIDRRLTECDRADVIAVEGNVRACVGCESARICAEEIEFDVAGRRIGEFVIDLV